MKLKEIREQVMSTDVGTNVLNDKNVLRHGSLLPMIRRPLNGEEIIPFKSMIKKKKEEKKMKFKNLKEELGRNPINIPFEELREKFYDLEKEHKKIFTTSREMINDFEKYKKVSPVLAIRILGNIKKLEEIDREVEKDMAALLKELVKKSKGRQGVN